MKYKIFKRDSIPIIVIFFFVLITILCFILDYFDLPTKIGINVNLINMDFWGIFIGNGIVVVLFIITFMLFDKRNLDKEKLANYTGAVLLQNTYKQCETFLPILERFLKSNGVEIIVVNNERTSPEQELVNDLISIIHVFSCRIYSLRKYKKQIEGDEEIAKELQDRNKSNV